MDRAYKSSITITRKIYRLTKEHPEFAELAIRILDAIIMDSKYAKSELEKLSEN